MSQHGTTTSATTGQGDALNLLHENRGCLDDLAANALERETLTREDLDEVFAAHELREPEPAPVQRV